MSSTQHNFDVVIIGGGIAGLWTLCALQRRGVNALLIEHQALGAGQTLASQGIIHGGIKYALGGVLGDASRAIAQMPAIWSACLEGTLEDESTIDLRGARVLSDHQYLWTTPGLISRVAGLGASKVIRTRVRSVGQADRPTILQAVRGIDVYRVDEPVLDVMSVIEAMKALVPGRVRRARSSDPMRIAHENERVVIEFAGGDRVVVRALVLAAGSGNAELMQAVGLKGADDFGVRQQIRPLHMVAATGAPAMLFGHVLGSSSVPRLTISSELAGENRGVPGGLATAASPSEGSIVWWIGGAIAEGEGVGRTPEQQIAKVKQELAACVPGVNIDRLQFSTSRWDRVEGVVGGAVEAGEAKEQPVERPDGPVVGSSGSVIVAWPTKLALAPLCAMQIVQRLSALGVETAVRGSSANNAAGVPTIAGLDDAPIGPRPWEARLAGTGAETREEKILWS